jgi:predicted negative regulator of RcsB-dependent stress response
MDQSSSSTDTILQLLAWLDKNKKRVALIGGAVLAAGALIGGIIYYQSQREARASEALSNVRQPSNPNTPVPPEVVQACLKVAKDFEGTSAAGRALLDAASILYTQGNFADSEARYKEFLNGYPDSPFLPQGMLGLAYALDAEGKTSDATAKYEELRRRFPTDPVLDDTKLALARIYEKQNPAEAYKLYNELVTTGGQQSGIASEAGIRMADLMEKYPDLAKTNAPTPPTMTPAPGAAQTVPTNLLRMVMTNARPASSNMIRLTNKAPRAPGPGAPTPLLITPEAPSTNKP